MTTSYDLVVIGGGAGGLMAAREARRSGASTVVVQDGPVGGDCTFTGCIPSKALLAAALSTEQIDVIDGFARFSSPTSIEVNGRTIRAHRFVVATGASPAVPAIPGLRDVSPLTNEDVFDLERRPDTMIVLGDGPIGCEMAQSFARLGTSITLVEGLDRILPSEEPDTSAVITDALAADGVDVRAGSTVTRSRGSTTVRSASTSTPELPSGRSVGLEDIGVDVDERGAVVVDETMATTVDGIWAVGDVTGGLQFTHAAGRMGWVAASNALSKLARVHRFRFDSSAVPWATFASPEVGRVGLTEVEAAERYPTARVAHLPLEHVDRAVAVGAERGFVKLIAAPNRAIGYLGGGRLVGATIVAPTGGDLIHEAALAMPTDMFVGRLAQATHAYPTWSMAVQQAALQFFGPSSGLEARGVRGQPSG